jgi:dipeptidyl aminopeptidase/acylaminoacyl peptidase
MNGGAPVQLTYGKENSTSTAWSPDGKRLAFVRSVDGKPQVFILPLGGGEAWQLTKHTHAAAAPRWSPDGNRILFSAAIQLKDLLKDSILNPDRSYPVWPSEKPGVGYTDMQRAVRAKPNANGSLDEVRAYLLMNEADGKATVLNKLNFQDETNISANSSFTQFYSINVSAGAAAKPILTGFTRYNTVDFTPDGKSLLITARIDSLEHPDRTQERIIPCRCRRKKYTPAAWTKKNELHQCTPLSFRQMAGLFVWPC